VALFPWENHGCNHPEMSGEKAWEKHGKMVGKWCFKKNVMFNVKSRIDLVFFIPYELPYYNGNIIRCFFVHCQVRLPEVTHPLDST